MTDSTREEKNPNSNKVSLTPRLSPGRNSPADNTSPRAEEDGNLRADSIFNSNSVSGSSVRLSNRPLLRFLPGKKPITDIHLLDPGPQRDFTYDRAVSYAAKQQSPFDEVPEKDEIPKEFGGIKKYQGADLTLTSLPPIERRQANDEPNQETKKKPKKQNVDDDEEIDESLKLKYNIDIVGLEKVSRYPDNNILMRPSSEFLLKSEETTKKEYYGSESMNEEMHMALIDKHNNIIRASTKNVDFGSFSLLSSLFRRAFHNERIGNLEKAQSGELKNPYTIFRASQLKIFKKLLQQNHFCIQCKDYTKCIRIDTMCSPAYFNRANIRYLQNDVDGAIRDLNQAILISPDNHVYYENRAMFMRKQGDYIQCAADIEKSRKLNPTNFSALKMNVSRVDPVIAYLAKQPRFRTDKEQLYIAESFKLLKSLAFLKDDMSSRLMLAQTATIKEYQSGKYVFRQGDVAVNYYILFQGQLKITQNKSNEKDEVFLKRLQRGDGFGKFSTGGIKNRRTANVVVDQDAVVLIVPSHVWIEITEKHQEQTTEILKREIRKCSAFQTWPEESLNSLMPKAFIKSFEGDSVIVRQGDILKELYIIRKGIVSVIKPTPKRLCRKTFPRKMTDYTDVNHTRFLRLETPGFWVLSDSWRDRIERNFPKKNENKEYYDFLVGVLCSGQTIGELCILDPDVPCPVTLIANTNVEVIAFQREDLISLGARFNGEMNFQLNTSIDLHNPSVEKCGYYFRNKMDWNEIKDQILNAQMSKYWVSKKQEAIKMAKKKICPVN